MLFNDRKSGYLFKKETAIVIVALACVFTACFSTALAEDSMSLWNPLSWNPMKLIHPTSSKEASPKQAESATPDTTQEKTTTVKSQDETEQPSQPDNTSQTSVMSPQTGKHSHKDTQAHPGAVLETERGDIVIELYSKEAPVTVKNFTKLVNQGFYNSSDMKFHRVIPGFIVQTGDPTGTGYGGSKRTIPLEVKNKLSHDSKGVVAMARGLTPDSGSSQFYITLSKQKTLDGKYAIFGRVIHGFNVLDQIEKGDHLLGIKLIDVSTIAHEDPTSPTYAPIDKKSLWESVKSVFR